MATTITNNYGKITFSISATEYDVNKSDIYDISLNTIKSRIEVHVKRGVVDGNILYIVFTDVTSPDIKSLGLLWKTIKNYWKEPGVNHAIFYADENQTAFDTTPRLKLTDAYEVYLAGVLTVYGFSRNGNIVTFDSGREESEEIIIKN